MYMCILLFAFPVFSFVAFSFSTLILLVGLPVKTVSHITYTVLDVIPQYNYTVIIYYSINPSSVIIIVADQYTAQSINQYFFRVA